MPAVRRGLRHDSTPRPNRAAGLRVARRRGLFAFTAGFDHARLLHRGYAEVEFVGPPFLLNGIATGVVVVAFPVDRIALFVIGALSIQVDRPSLRHGESSLGLAPTGAARQASKGRIAQGGDGDAG